MKKQFIFIAVLLVISFFLISRSGSTFTDTVTGVLPPGLVLTSMEGEQPATEDQIQAMNWAVIKNVPDLPTLTTKIYKPTTVKNLFPFTPGTQNTKSLLNYAAALLYGLNTPVDKTYYKKVLDAVVKAGIDPNYIAKNSLTKIQLENYRRVMIISFFQYMRTVGIQDIYKKNQTQAMINKDIQALDKQIQTMTKQLNDMVNSIIRQNPGNINIPITALRGPPAPTGSSGPTTNKSPFTSFFML